jgi:predicted nucleotide-binding protein
LVHPMKVCTWRDRSKALDNDFRTIIRWDQDVFSPSDYPLSRLIEIVNCYDFGIFVYGPDDIAELGGKRVLIARDNVIFEAGLFFSQLDRKRVFLVKPDKPSATSLPPFHLPMILRSSPYAPAFRLGPSLSLVS